MPISSFLIQGNSFETARNLPHVSTRINVRNICSQRRTTFPRRGKQTTGRLFEETDFERKNTGINYGMLPQRIHLEIRIPSFHNAVYHPPNGTTFCDLGQFLLCAY